MKSFEKESVLSKVFCYQKLFWPFLVSQFLIKSSTKNWNFLIKENLSNAGISIILTTGPVLFKFNKRIFTNNGNSPNHPIENDKICQAIKKTTKSSTTLLNSKNFSITLL
ncbi:Uncharacterized protein ACO02O_04361 [Dirofilaria immitis]